LSKRKKGGKRVKIRPTPPYGGGKTKPRKTKGYFKENGDNFRKERKSTLQTSSPCFVGRDGVSRY